VGNASTLSGNVQRLVGLSVLIKSSASLHSGLLSEPLRCHTLRNCVALIAGRVQRAFVVFGRSRCVLGDDDDEEDGEQTRHFAWRSDLG
jgi:hypothetical protein